MFPRRFFAGRYFAPRFFPQNETAGAVGTLRQTFLGIPIGIRI